MQLWWFWKNNSLSDELLTFWDSAKKNLFYYSHFLSKLGLLSVSTKAANNPLQHFFSFWGLVCKAFEKCDITLAFQHINEKFFVPFDLLKLPNVFIFLSNGCQCSATWLSGIHLTFLTHQNVKCFTMPFWIQKATEVSSGFWRVLTTPSFCYFKYYIWL